MAYSILHLTRSSQTFETACLVNRQQILPLTGANRPSCSPTHKYTFKRAVIRTQTGHQEVGIGKCPVRDPDSHSAT
eukprot:2243876-Pyramimonas_sp.AAC.1